MTDDIRQMWEAVRSGDSGAWRRLVRMYSSLVYTVARRTGLPELDAEDCAQQTWIALFRRRRAIKDPAAIPAWLIRTTQRQAIHMLRRLSRDTGEDTLSRQEALTQLPDAMIQQLEHQVILETAISRLDPRCRKLLTELFLSENRRPYREIARSLRIQPNSLGPLRSRCLHKLKNILEKMGYPAD